MTAATSSSPARASAPDRPAPAGSPATFTGRKRRATRRVVRLVDVLARWTITTGGISVTLAFAAIVVFLVTVVVPLFRPARIARMLEVQLALAPGRPPLAMEAEENLTAVWILDADGNLLTCRVDGGEVIRSQPLSADAQVTAVSNSRGVVAIGRADGTARLGRIGYQVEWMPAESDALAALLPGQTAAHDGGVAELTPLGQARIVRVVAELSEPLAVGDGDPSAIELIDSVASNDLEATVAVRADGRLFYNLLRKRRNMLTGKYATALSSHELPPGPRAAAGERPAALLMGSNGRMVFVAYADGELIRYDTSDPANPRIAEQTDLLPDTRRISSVRMLLGDVTLVVADDAGGASGWFAAPASESGTTDGMRMTRAHVLSPQHAAVTSIATSSRDRQFITGDAEGRVLLRHMTSGTTQGRVELQSGAPVALLAMSPRNDALVALDQARRLELFALDNPHPDASIRALLGRVHYEGYARPEHIWQSSAGTDDAEPKHGMVPLIFGTLKATIYAMLLAVPVALLASVYSSEFMRPRLRAAVKPTIEMMAGLPSVVLGFIGALVLAPLVEASLPALLTGLVLVPLAVAVAGSLWQLLPPHVARLAPPWIPFAATMLVVLLAVGAARALGPLGERFLFGGDVRGWLGGRLGTGRLGAVPGWMLLLTPLAGVGLIVVDNTFLRPRYGPGPATSRPRLLAYTLGRFAVLAAASVALAGLLGAALSAAGLDLRHGALAPAGPYVQRNTLIVGIVMGFAIIPIIYTVCDDALTSVPASLRSAALGAGATPWQTAMRVVIPVAMSGIFSACMIGLGRAAGETMIVLMAAGNTPLLDLSAFNGARTLSANIAVELPEAPVHSTHYRILFLSGLVLFAITFVVNTAAEIVRARFRRRAFQL